MLVDKINTQKTFYLVNNGTDKYEVSFNVDSNKKYVLKPGDAQIVNLNTTDSTMNLYIKTLLAQGKHSIDLSQGNIFDIGIKESKKVEIRAIQSNVTDETIAENFIVHKQLSDLIYFDELHKYICIPKKTLFTGKFDRVKSSYYKFSDIRAVELQADGKTIASSTKGGLTSALVGGALFGGTGALVGAVTGNKKTSYANVTDFTIRILLNSLSNPCESISVRNDRKQANQILSALEIILDDNKGNSSTNNNSNNNLDKFDEIKKYKELLDQNIISSEEFETKKKELLQLK